MVFFRTAHQNANADSFSVVYDLLNTAALFNLCNDVKNMVEHGHQYSKQIWKDKVWETGIGVGGRVLANSEHVKI